MGTRSHEARALRQELADDDVDGNGIVDHAHSPAGGATARNKSRRDTPQHTPWSTQLSKSVDFKRDMSAKPPSIAKDTLAARNELTNVGKFLAVDLSPRADLGVEARVEYA